MGRLPNFSIGAKLTVAGVGASLFGCLATAAMIQYEVHEVLDRIGGVSAADDLRTFNREILLWLAGLVLFSFAIGLLSSRLVVGPMRRFEAVLKRLADLQPVDAIPYLERHDILGRVARLVAALRDSETARRAAEQALSRSEGRLRMAIDGAGLAPWDWDAATDMVTYSGLHHHLFGGQLPLRSSFSDFLAIVHPDDRGLFALGRKRYQPNREVQLQYRVRLPDGGIRRLESRGMPFFAADGSLDHVIGVQWDITEQHDAVEKLKQSEARRKLAIEAAGLMLWHWDILRDQVTFEASGEMDALLATQGGCGADLRNLIHPDDREAMRAARETARATGLDMAITYRQRARDGSWAWIEQRARPLRNEGGIVTDFVGVLWDVTEQQRNLAGIRERKAQLRSVLAAVPDAVLILDELGLIQSISGSAQRLFDLAEDAAKGLPVTRLLPSCRRDPQGTGLPAYLFAGRPQRMRGLRRDGTLVPVELAASRLAEGGATGFVVFARDLSERERSENHVRELQAQLFHSTRLSAMGQTASALAHEINQPLAALANYLEVARSRLGGLAAAGTDLQTLLGKAVDQAGRATAIVRRIRGFVEKAAPVLAAEPVAGMLAEALELALLGRHQVRSEFHVASNLPEIQVDRIQIQQVIVNLVRNGAEAASALRGDAAVVQLDARLADDAVEISVRDNGPGVDEQRRRNLFRPFNTSKAEGMGIGLSVSRAIVEAHGGRIWVDDPKENEGACFHLTLPLPEAA